MPALLSTSFSGQVVWLGRVVRDRGLLHSEPADSLELAFSGVPGERHAGMTRASCGRVTNLYRRGTEIRNTRQLSILSMEELSDIAAALGLDMLDPSLLGATMVLRGIPDLTHLPPSSRLQADDGATLTVDMENRPCSIPARAIEAAHPGKGAGFKDAADGRRGVTAWVEREGDIRLGDTMRLFVPDQRAWSWALGALADRERQERHERFRAALSAPQGRAGTQP